ncbi:MAG: hypothetical protein GXO64_02865 [Candidatus Micrarchaeota archaeon]|nr:hypothetical protein [Candidatus Micrarchaeota archaeon]
MKIKSLGKLLHKEAKTEKTARTAKDFIIANWQYLFLLAIVILAFGIRYMPARHGELQALDPFYIYRMTDYVLTHNMQFPELDTLRYYPFGLPTPKYEFPGPFYIPAILYLVFFQIFGLSLFSFAFIYSPLMGALGVLVMYFIARELFDDKIAGLFSAFFLAVVPGFITRTSAGFFEKEPGATPFMLLSVYFFIRAYKKNSWIDGLLGGLSLGIMSITWGGAEYMRMFFALVTLVLLIVNKYSDGLLKGYTPIVIFSVLLPYIMPRPYDIMSTASIVPIGILAILLLRYGIVKYNIVKKDQVPYLVPAMVLLSFVGALIGSTQSRFIWDKLMSVSRILLLSKGVMGSTVAENAPGTWGNIMDMFGAKFSGAIFPQLSPYLAYFSVYILMLFGALFLAYEIYKKRDMLYLIPLLWLITTIWATLGYVRLLFLLGPAAAITAGFFVAELFKYSEKARFEITVTEAKRKVNLTLVIVALFAVLLIVVNISSAYVFGNSIGPSYNKFFDEAMTFMKEKTPENSSILSWWDFGYWFQTRGERPSIADGGNVKLSLVEEIARWYTDNPNNWTNYTWFFSRYKPDYILMDYTLPGKYGAISKISSDGKQIIGIMQFRNNGATTQDNKTIYQFSAPPYELWVPFESTGAIAGRPVFLISQNGRYYQKAYINDLCTTNGIITLGNVTSDTMPGCISLTNFGVFYIPPEAEHTIFTSLMFMDGYGLEDLEKVFDNGAIRIYKVDLDKLAS